MTNRLRVLPVPCLEETTRCQEFSVLSDGKPVPAETRVLVGRDAAWDTQTVTVDADGRFSFTGLPPEQLDLSTNIRGYHPSAKNVSLDILNRSGLVGTIGADIDGLRFLLEPGPHPEIDYRKFSREDHAENHDAAGQPPPRSGPQSVVPGRSPSHHDGRRVDLFTSRGRQAYREGIERRRYFAVASVDPTEAPNAIPSGGPSAVRHRRFADESGG